ncbi:ribonucleoside-diphosphate reductase, adenosylcobalamin-dependent [Candidatus Beckwithbacteria bacterium RBG_13_42_9]|uniref:Vitamin B12-dependent ribonucleotide reductase n=1 Tax=Candidatus Beckwithbacteria bacterium RBG_13_42_9 TaxID=1797457 RepID=A0A1F5E8S4_9BACT|nr:MAG: ribonucleoside-diphosphate reductase, adenosylcobalamin-dependent [Candidatus Beckwithbacteria bacterium RBG_13_42_9]
MKKITEPKLSTNALKIAEKRYLRTDMQGKIVETPGEMFWRVACHLAKPEINWGTNGIVEKMAKAFFERMVNLKFVVAGKAMFEAGNPGGTGQLSSCFVLPVTDNIQSIFRTLGDAAVVHKNNGGTGFNFSQIRPRGDKVKNVPQAASGPVDFLLAYSAALARILQGSKRQGANIGILNCDHPDIEEFINLKAQDGTVKNFNISVGVTDEFMEAVNQDKNWELKNPRNGEVWKKIKAGGLFEMIAQSAWATGDPGLAFLDRMEADNPTPALGKQEATNPCGEISLLPYESCNLTSIVLSNHLKKAKSSQLKAHSFEIDWEDLEKSIKLGVRLLDNMIEVNTYVVSEIEQMVKYGNRRIGLGVMGFAHLLYKLGIPYNSQEAIRLSERLAKFIRQKAEETSLELGKERGPFPNWDRSIYAGSAEKYRNCALTMIAPTGTTSLLANCSSGIEPVFSLVTLRKTFFEDDRSNRPTKELTMVDPIFEEYLRAIKQYSHKAIKKIMEQTIQEGGLKKIKELTEKEKRIFVTTHQIAPEWHIKIQAAWQKHFDNSVSKTINFSHAATLEEVKRAYHLAWKLGCKGITIYRDGSKQNQVLNLTGLEKSEIRNTKFETLARSRYAQGVAGENPNDQISNNETIPNTKYQILNSDVCPECGSVVEMIEGCATCKNCGWSKCKL